MEFQTLKVGRGRGRRQSHLSLALGNIGEALHKLSKKGDPEAWDPEVFNRYSGRGNRRQRGGDFIDHVLGKIQERNPGMSREEARQVVARSEGKPDWGLVKETNSPLRNIYNAMTNPRNYTISADLIKKAIPTLIQPLISGSLPNPFKTAELVADGVRQVMGKGKKRNRRYIYN